MKKISLKIIKLRIRLLQKILAVIGITAIISSCASGPDDSDEGGQDSVITTDVIQQDSLPPSDTIGNTSEPVSQEPPKQNNTPPVVPDVNKPDHPMTKYGVPVDDDDFKARYGVPMPSDVDRI